MGEAATTDVTKRINLVLYRHDGDRVSDAQRSAGKHLHLRDDAGARSTRSSTARMDESVQVIVITGNGEKFFSAGANIHMLANVTPTFKYYFCLHANETLSRLEQTPKLVIAAINGHCVGGGLEVAMAADMRIARKAPARWVCRKFHSVFCRELAARSVWCAWLVNQKRLS